MGKLIYGLEPDNAIDKIHSLSCPVLFIHGQNDNGIPVSDAHELYEASNKELNEIWVVPNADHSQAYSLSSTEYCDRVVTFLTIHGHIKVK